MEPLQAELAPGRVLHTAAPHTVGEHMTSDAGQPAPGLAARRIESVSCRKGTSERLCRQVSRDLGAGPAREEQSQDIVLVQGVEAAELLRVTQQQQRIISRIGDVAHRMALRAKQRLVTNRGHLRRTWL